MNIKTLLNPANRGRIYATVAAIVGALVTFGVVSTSIAPLIVGLVLSVITLGMAIVNSKNTVRTAIYGVCAAVGALLVALGIIDGAQTDALIAIAAPLLGITLAAAKTPAQTVADEVDSWPKTV